MAILDLKVKDLRNIKRAELNLSEKTNIITGGNASGKTSLLEAIYFLCLSQSFRTSKPNELIRKDQVKLQVIACHNSEKRVSHTLGIERDRKSSKIRYAGETLKKKADLVRNQPVVIIPPDCHQLITGGPSKRRSLIDWVMFHVEHDYFYYWQRFNKILKQRNALLKRKIGGKELDIWDERLIESAFFLNREREKAVFHLLVKLRKIIEELQSLPVEFEYESGWGVDEYSSALKKTRKKDLMIGYTTKGPHRAELLIKTQGKLASSILSRGQTKLLSTAIEIAKTRLLLDQTGKEAIIMIDDLAAELDKERKEQIKQMLETTKLQQIITVTDIQQIPDSYREKSKVFHVEHGDFTEVIY